MTRRRGEQGFALLFIFVLMAGIAIGMLMQLPRVAFETQREREEMLIDRGEQYQRAIGLYVKTMKRYPGKIEDLESTNNMRFLRRRYIDPMTGKDEWRLIHVGPNGQLLDSLVKKPAQTNAATKDGKPADSQNAQHSMNADPSNTVGTNNAPPEVNQAVRARPSDQVGVAGVMNQANPYGYPQPPQPYGQQQLYGQPQAPGQQPYPQTVPMAGVQPGQQYIPGQHPQPPVPGQPLQQYLPGQPQPVPGQPLPAGYNPYVAQAGQQPSTITPGQQPAYPGGYQQPAPPGVVQPGQQQQPAQYVQGQPVYVQPVQPGMPQPQPGQPYNPMQNMPGVIAPPQGQVAQPGLPQYPQTVQQYAQAGQPQPQGANLPPGSTPQGQATAQQMIQNILTSPRQPPPSAFNNQGFGGGIAGVATNYKSPSIKIYNERQKYQEWEFIYDPKKDPALNPTIATGGAPPGSTSSPAASSSTGLSNSSGSAFSNSSGSSSFSNTSGSSVSGNGLSGSPQPSPAPGAR